MLHLGHGYKKSITHLQAMTGDLDIVMPMYNLLEYSDNYSERSRSLWNY